MAGIFFAVVGPSGAGKDTILEAARPRLLSSGDFYFPTRYITRPADAGGENHKSISNVDFVKAVREDRFSLWWMAHGLHYALPDTVYQRLRVNEHVIANISRRSVDEAVQKFNRVEVMEITASPETLRNRLLLRERESEAEIMVRQLREIDNGWSGRARVTTISNDGQLGEAVEIFIAKVLSLTDRSVREAQRA